MIPDGGGRGNPFRVARIARLRERLSALYRRWAAGGAGLLITGNVLVYAEALTGPAGVVLDGAAPLEPFTE